MYVYQCNTMASQGMKVDSCTNDMHDTNVAIRLLTHIYQGPPSGWRKEQSAILKLHSAKSMFLASCLVTKDRDFHQRYKKATKKPGLL